MEVNKIIQNVRNHGVAIWSENGKICYINKDGKLDDSIKDILVANKKEIVQFFEEDRNRFDNFPLTDIQMAYLLGRRGSFEYGDVASHLYLELDYPALDSAKVQQIWNELINEHDMLRAIILENGTQKVLRNVKEYQIYISKESEEIRHKWSDKYYNTEIWPMFDIGITESTEKSTLHLSFDFLIADWASIWILLMEFEEKYYNKTKKNKDSTISFRNYVLNEIGMKNGIQYSKDREYWAKRLDTIPEAPNLPLQSNTAKSNRFTRIAQTLKTEEWKKIKSFSMQKGVTPTATVLSIFSMCLERWSVNKKFALNLTTLMRNDKYTNIYKTIGDFTSVDILEVDLSREKTFSEFVKEVNKQIFEDLDHNSYSGIEVIRDLRKKRKNNRLFYPIIFTSSIGLIELDRMRGKINNNGISQTPQAFLDCQVMDSEDGLHINWDVREGIFEKGVIQDIFCVFIKSLKLFSESLELWDRRVNIELPENQMTRRKKINDTFKEMKEETLQNLFINSALKMPKKIAVIDENGKYTYEELLWTAYGIADELQRCGCKKTDYVGIKLNKSFFQIASVLGTLLAGAAFVPIDNEQPEIRANKMMEIAKIQYLIGEKEDAQRYERKYKWIEKEGIINKKEHGNLVRDNYNDVAYVIFTSGSTGEPKGVVVEQKAVVNTIMDINQRFGITDQDSVLALSQLHFDLSIYDIFGMLSAGGTLVIPDRTRYKDPSYWLILAEKWNITVWNSVPTFMGMFVDYLEKFYKGENLSLDKILLSGDWIPTKLPERIRRFFKNVRIYSLGGATEASIWSIYHECKANEQYSNSIPYGIPLSNQGFKILDMNMKECPDMVQGEIYITGKGLAKEYLGDIIKTQNSFLQLNNERIYKTGDFGRYLYNGEIEFLGRKDSQVKISGHRIDTGEIENAILDCYPSKNCCVTTIDLNNDPKLVAVIVTKDKAYQSEEEIRKALQRCLPDYMIPVLFEFIEQIPCLQNGKVDRKAIQRIFTGKRKKKKQKREWELTDPIEKEVFSIIVRTLKVDKLYPDDNLFEMGADSLLMAQIAGSIKKSREQNSVTFDEILRHILNNPTGEAIIKFIRDRQNISVVEESKIENLRLSGQNSKEAVYIFFHTALGTTSCYRFLEKELQKMDVGDLLFINIENIEWYYSIQPNELVDKITDRYVNQIAQLNYKRINLVGYCLGGILALNVAVKLLERGLEIDNLFVIDSYLVSGKIEDEFIDEMIFLPNYQLTLSEVIEGVDDYELMESIAKQRQRNMGNIPPNTFSEIIKENKELKGKTSLQSFAGNTKEKRFEAYAKAIEQKAHTNVNSELLENTFRVYQHGFKGAEVELPFYSGNIYYLSACDEQKYFFVNRENNLEMWKNICIGEFEAIDIPGNHVTCIHNKDNALLVAQIIEEKGSV